MATEGKRQKCSARTKDGHNCSKPAKDGHRLCWLHLRQRKPPEPKAQSSDLQKILDELECEDAQAPSMHAGMMFLVKCWAGEIKEWKTSGGEGPLQLCELSGKDRIAAVNTWLMRYPQVYGEGESDNDAAIRQLRTALGIEDAP